MKTQMASIIAGVLLFFLFAGTVRAELIPGKIPENMQKLFSSRRWDMLDAAFEKGGSGLSVKDRVLYANALWFQGDYEKGLKIFREEQNTVPAGILPYLRMRIVLGLERTGKADEALQEAIALGEDKDWILAPYVQYAIGRIARSTGKTELAVEAFRSMARLARDEAQRLTALEALFDLSAAEIQEARMLLAIESRNMDALALLEDAGPPYPAKDALFLAEAALSEKRPEKALEYLEDTRFEGKKEKDQATLLTARARAALGEKKEAADMLYRLAVMEDTGPADVARAISIMKQMACEGDGEYAKGLLAAIAESGTSRASALSMAAMAEINRRDKDGKRKTYWEDRLLGTHPNSPLTVPIRWERGWKAWKQESPEKAARLWEAALQAGPDGRDEAKLLFWLRRALNETGQQTDLISNRLEENHPLDFYTFAAFRDRALPLSEEKSILLEHERHELETWGFMVYARMHLSEEGTPGALYRASQISQWLGDPHGSYMHGQAILRAIPRDGTLPPELVQILFPRPFDEAVRKASERFDVPVYDIWGIMRRESAFNPLAVSYVGAMGLMQLMPPTARENARLLGLDEGADYFSPEVNIRLGAHHFGRLRGMFERTEQAVAAYNAGQGRVRSWLENTGKKTDWMEWVEEIPFDETREFVRQVMANRNVYMRLEDGETESIH
ncbi:MAG: transglycosylase SLT domain-containing protein [Thermovirgaceae bacterium]